MSVTHTHEQRIRSMFAAIDDADWEQLLSLYHPQVVYERPGYDPLVGHERILRFYRHERRVASGTHTLEGILVADGEGVCWGSMRGTLSDGATAHVRFAEVYAFADAAIQARRSYFFTPAV